MIPLGDLRSVDIQGYMNRLHDAGYPIVSFDGTGAMLWVVCSGKDKESIRGEGASYLSALAQAYAVATQPEKGVEA